MRRFVVACLGLLLLAPLAQAQFIDCAGGCSDTLYGLGNDPREGPHLRSTGIGRPGPGDGSCGPELFVRLQGQIRIREQNGCVVSATTRCPVEIPQIALDSGTFNTSQGTIDLGPLGIFAFNGANYTDYGGNLGFRQLSGTCGVSGDECALDSECDAQNPGDVCTSTCFSDPGTSCSSHADCAADDCRTEIEWDGIGLCTDNATVCSLDADCPDEQVCQAGISRATSPSSCVCCQSASGVVCPFLGQVEYPALNCGVTIPSVTSVAAPDWLFEGGRGTPFGPETLQVPGQQEGLCAGNRLRPCGALGDFWAGAANGKCTSGTAACAADPFNQDDLALESQCDDVAFGGVAGDFCDLTEDGIRTTPLNPDGTQDTSQCIDGSSRIIGTPGELCAVPLDIPEGDPQPGCRIRNIGIVGQPDINCNGIDDTNEGRCMPAGGAVCSDAADCPPCTLDGDCTSGVCVSDGDLCPFIGEDNWFLDSNNDNIGDECQCGDGTGDGAITSPDIAAAALCANGVLSEACDPTILDATGDNATTAEDIGGIVSVVNGVITTSALECLRNLDLTQ